MNRTTVKGLVLFTAAATALAVAPASGAMAAPGAPAADSAGAAKIAWGQCESPSLQRRGAECGLLDVPLDYSKPNGKKIQLAVSRIKAQGRREATTRASCWSTRAAPAAPASTLSVLGRVRPQRRRRRLRLDRLRPARRRLQRARAVAATPTTSTGRVRSTSRANQGIEQTWLTRSKDYAKACGEGRRRAAGPHDHGRLRQRHGVASARRSAPARSTSTASPTAPTSARSTARCTRSRCAAWCSTATSTRGRSGTRPTSTRTSRSSGT